MNSGSALSHNVATSHGGGVYINNGTFTMNSGSIISHNVATSYGGGVYNTGTFTLNGGEITHNIATSGGGVASMDKNFYMNGGEISHNKAGEAVNKINDCGGGVYISNSGFYMTGGKITENFAAYGGGGVYSTNNGDVNIEGGVISNNKAGRGGGIYDLSAINMSGGEISGNTATIHGGGVYINSYDVSSVSKFTMTGGMISGNTATTGGGGVYSEKYSIFNMSGGEISGNTAVEGGGVYNNSASVNFEMTGGTISGNTSTKGGGAIMSSGTITLTGGTISGNESPEGGGILNYGTLNMSGSAAIINNEGTRFGGGVSNLGSNALFRMTGGVISGNTAMVGGGVNMDGGRVTFIMSGDALICNNKATLGATTYGGGVVNFGGGLFIMEGGKITGNEAIGTNIGYGGGVMNNSDKFEMTGGTISDNIATQGGGIHNTSAGILNVISGNIINNTAKGPTAQNAKGNGGGIYTSSFAALTVGDGVVFSGNKAPTLRIYDISGDDLVIYKEKISNNVKLDKMFGVIETAPVFNNFDINYTGDVYVVTIVIEPKGSGTVTLTDSGDGTVYGMTEDGHVFVPTTADPIALSASPKDDYEFLGFVINNKQSEPIDITIESHTEIVVNFSSLITQPDEHIITAESDEGSTIASEGDVEVPHGEDKTFMFSPKPGFRITAVFVDDIEISSDHLEAGEFTFTNVESNHTIRVVSEAYDENENENGGTGTGPGGSGGTGPGGNNGTGTGPGGSGGGNETGPGGSDGSDVGANGGTGSAESGEWAVLNLVCAALAILTGLIAFIAGRGRSEGNTEKKKPKTSVFLRALALIIGIVSVVVFFLTEEWSLPAAAADGLTPLMFVLFLAVLILTLVSFRFDGEPKDEDAGTGQA